MPARLIAENESLEGLAFTLKEGEKWTIGRDPDQSQFVVDDPSVSRAHLLITSSPEGFRVQNLSETNPAFLNESKIPSEGAILHDGDTIQIGEMIFRFNDEEELIKNAPSNNQEETSPVLVPAEDLSNSEEEHRNSVFEDREEGEENGSLAEINFAVEEGGRWLLKVVSGPNNGAEFAMQTDASYVLGTDPNTCDIVFHDTSVSRQHAKITASSDDSLSITDLNSRNGTLVDGQKIEGKISLPLNTVINLGTTSFIVYDREGEMQTIISPLLPSIVKVLQQEEKTEREGSDLRSEQTKSEAGILPVSEEKEKTGASTGSFLLIALLTGLFVLLGIGTTTLFRSEPVAVKQEVDENAITAQALEPFRNVRYSYNKSTGRLLLLGHVLTASDKNQLLYNLQGLDFIKDVDDSGIIIDEFVWREINLILNKNPDWKGVSIYSTEAGKFVLSGYLQIRRQAEQLYNYISVNFPYLDLLEKRVVVEEEILTEANLKLLNEGFRNLQLQIANGEITIQGKIPSTKSEDFAAAITEIREIPGVRGVKDLVAQTAVQSGMINLSDQYEVTGVSRTGRGTLNVVVNGRILTVGDTLDGMTITQIRPNTILLEREDERFRIDF